MNNRPMTMGVAGVLVGVLAGFLLSASMHAAAKKPVFKGMDSKDAAEALLVAGLEAAGGG